MRFYDTSSSIDRKRALEDLGQNIKGIWRRLPKAWRHDKEFVIKVLTVANLEPKEKDICDDSDDDLSVCSMSDAEEDAVSDYMGLPCKADFERSFPQRLLADEDVVLAWTRRPDFKDLHRRRYLPLPPSLSGNKKVCLAYCRKIPRCLQDCSLELCDDEELVAAAIEHNGGLELQYASLRLQSDEAMLRKACLSDAKALNFCPRTSDAFQKIVQDRDFMLCVVLGGTGRPDGSLWKLLPWSWKQNDPDLVLEAVKNGLPLRYVPKHFLTLDFFRKALHNNAVPLYSMLPQKWQEHPILALEAIVAKDSNVQIQSMAYEHIKDVQWEGKSLPKECSSKFPLVNNLDVVAALSEKKNTDLLYEMLNVPKSLWSRPRFFEVFSRDPKVYRTVKLLVQANPSWFFNLHEEFQEDPSIILLSIQKRKKYRDSAFARLTEVPWEIQRQHPEITIKCLSHLDDKHLDMIPGAIPEDVWESNRDLRKVWIRRGGRLFESFFPSILTDREMILEVVKQTPNQFSRLNLVLTSEKNFVRKVLALSGECIKYIPFMYRRELEFDFIILAVANFYNHYDRKVKKGKTPKEMVCMIKTFETIYPFDCLKQAIQAKVGLFDRFIQCFLRGIAIHNPCSGKNSKLTMLDQGAETSAGYKRLIAEYLGVPLGNELYQIRKALVNIKRAESLKKSTGKGAVHSSSPARERRNDRNVRRRVLQ